MSKDALTNSPLVLIIRDGWGENPNSSHDRFNAVKLACTPVADRLMDQWPATLIRTCGEEVGLPPATMGNSEVGHQNIGAGRIVEQETVRITRAIRDGSFFNNAALGQAFNHALRTSGNVHLLGLVSDGLIHSDIQHLFALIDLAAGKGFGAGRLFVHAIIDGRDTGPHTGLGFIERLDRKLAEASVGRIATVMGRYYALDRDHRWERVARAYACLTAAWPPETLAVAGARRTTSSATEAVQEYYDRPSEPNRSGDEFIDPTQIVEPTDEGTLVGLPRIADGDAVIFFNFRGDRPRELTKAFVLDDHRWAKVQGGGFDRGPKLDDLYFCTMTGYEAGLPVTAVAFEKPPKMPDILGDVISRAGLTQFRCAESEKYPHVTLFFNDYREEPFAGESWLLAPSPREVSTYDQKPQMSAYEVCDAVLGRLAANDCETLIVVNFANGDMVGHTGNLDAATRAIEVVDECVGRIVDAALAREGSLMVTADHGNAEQMWDPQHDCPHTAHTTYDVPLIVIGEAFQGRSLRSAGRLADIAPTVLAMLGLEQPAAMTGCCLLQPIPASTRKA